MKQETAGAAQTGALVTFVLLARQQWCLQAAGWTGLVDTMLPEH
jgi:hypothetical protein